MYGLVTVAVDGSTSALAAVDWVADDAARSGKAVRVVHVREPWAGEYPFHRVEGFDQSMTDYCEGVLAKAAARVAERAPGVKVTTELATGAVVERLKDESGRTDVLVLGSRGMGGFTGLVVGSVGIGLAGHAAGPVVIVRGPLGEEHGEIIVGVDGSPHSEAALEFAFEQAKLRGARLHAVHAWAMPAFSPLAAGYTDVFKDVFESATRQAGQWLAAWRQEHPEVTVAETVVCGHPTPALVEASEKADLVVVGSRGLGGFKGAVLGSVGHGVLHGAHCPVAIVRPREAQPREERPGAAER
ncbi:universal stress protein [Sphaerisporangium melleum]|uniref:Universal stress protein n=1 Tax=Sphaerisporangium melleum TaxID=321316 RepID=A0A917RM66_9ACTN|nr:universal stress protein [Sphaerisporangium melleum]GGL13693.1 universal stress protein [Sphaerisporangium melleum]GII74528.1 universal stress protein [Sphaerisporangium melleum]